MTNTNQVLREVTNMLRDALEAQEGTRDDIESVLVNHEYLNKLSRIRYLVQQLSLSVELQGVYGQVPQE